MLRESLDSVATHAADGPLNVIVESNSLLQFLKPSLYLTVLDPRIEDFKPSAQKALDRADAFVLRHYFAVAAATWPQVSAKLLEAKPAFLQKEGGPLPPRLLSLVRDSLTRQAIVRI